jgi:phosphate starvation-inducible PhoH-like protein
MVNPTQKSNMTKRRPKTPIKFKISLNEEQKIAKSIILDNTITILTGKAGSGKTLLSCQVALDGLFNRIYEKIIITRPTVATSSSEIGHLPGDIYSKLKPWLEPIFQNFYTLYKKEKIIQLIEDEIIEIVPVTYMRGRTFLNSCIIVDEAQNITHEQMEMITSRIGLNSKMIVCGDTAQIDLKNKSESGFKFLYTLSKKIKNMESFSLQKNHRDPIVDLLLEHYYDFKHR